MSVIINCPNGRQQSMKVTPNTSILEVFIFYLFFILLLLDLKTILLQNIENY
jgi:hypothetical protein